MLDVRYQLAVNPFADEGQFALNAEQLWAGLLLRVLEPVRFTIGLDEAQVAQLDESTYQRELFFGAQCIRDQVTLEHGRRVQFVTESTDTAPTGQLSYQIETHPTQGLLLHCHYATAFPEPSSDEERQLLLMIENAYRMADEDMLRIIREYAQMARH